MAILLARPLHVHPLAGRRAAAPALTALAHLLLVLGWQTMRRLASPDARREPSRIISGNSVICETDRAPTTSIDMIEKHGKQRFTNCTARDP